jgi:putative chitinase
MMLQLINMLIILTSKKLLLAASMLIVWATATKQAGDGFKYLGRGLIQLTGKNNYTIFAASIDTPLEDIPEYLQTFEGAVQSACWFWEQNNLNQWADKGDILTLTKRINGGTIGLEDRIKHYNHAVHLFVGH